MNIEAEVTVKDIINFYVKINDAFKAKKDIAQLSAKDKAAAFEIIASSSASRDFRVEVARYFIYDLDARVRRKAERFLEDLVPGWVSDPAESILKLLKSADGKGVASRNAAVKFLFGIVDATSLRDTFMTLLNGRNRAHMSEIIAILENYIDSSSDEQEQVKIFDACLDIVLSDNADDNIKHHASNLVSVFFKKVLATNLGETLRRKYLEKQIEKAEGVYRYLCSGSAGLNTSFLADLLRPFHEGGSAYQVKILNFFKMVLEKSKNPDEADTVLDIYPDYWNKDEQPKEEKIRIICNRILRAVDELWEATDDSDVHELIIRIRYGEYADKRELLAQVCAKLEAADLKASAREKIATMLRCFLLPGEQEMLKLQVAHLLLCKMVDTKSRLDALDYLASYLENRELNYAEKGSIATVTESLLNEKNISDNLSEKACYVLFISDPGRLKGEGKLEYVLRYVNRAIADRRVTAPAKKRIDEALGLLADADPVGQKIRKALQSVE